VGKVERAESGEIAAEIPGTAVELRGLEAGEKGGVTIHWLKVLQIDIRP
jgi:hypothetical protein